jgi:hypothetical protein
MDTVLVAGAAGLLQLLGIALGIVAFVRRSKVLAVVSLVLLLLVFTYGAYFVLVLLGL